MAVVFELDGSINAANHFESFGFPGTGNFGREDLAKLQSLGNPFDRKYFFPGQFEESSVLTLEELERQDTHSDQIAAVDPFITFRDHGANPQ